MGKNVFMFLMLFSIIISSNAREFVINSEYKDYLFTFEKLKADEILGYEFYSPMGEKNYNFELYTENKTTGKKRIIGQWYSAYGDYQFSEDRKSAVFFLDKMYIESYKNSFLSPLFFVDGSRGEIKYLFDNDSGMMTNRTLKYLLSQISGGETGYKFAVVDLKEKKIVKTIEWKVTDRPGGGCRIFRSKDLNYDFRIDYISEGGLFAVCYYNIEKDKLDVIFDNTGLIDKNGELIEEGLKREQILSEEVGREIGRYKFN